MATTTYGTPYVQSSDLVSSYPGTSSTLATRIDAVSYAGNGLNDQTGTSYTLVLTDVGKTITLSNAGAVTVTIPANSSVAAPAGSIVRFVNKGAGTVTIQPTGGVTLNGGNLTLPQFAAVQIVKLATDTWGVVESTGSTALRLITTASLSGASVSINNCFTSANEVYLLTVWVESSADVLTNLRLRASGADASGSNYSMAYFNPASATVTTTGFFMTYGNTGTSYGTAQMYLYRPAAAAPTGMNVFGGNSGQPMFATGRHTLSTAYDGFTLYPASGTFTSGTVRVYALSNS